MTTGGRGSDPLFRELLALAEALAEELRGTTATVSLRFEGGTAPLTRMGARP